MTFCVKQVGSCAPTEPPFPSMLKRAVRKLFESPKPFQTITVNGTPLLLSQRSLVLPVEGRLLPFLKGQTIYPQVYWHNPQEQVSYATIGAVDYRLHPPTIEKNGSLFQEDPHYFGGQDFQVRQARSWHGIPRILYFLPLLELKREQNTLSLILNLTPTSKLPTIRPPSPIFEDPDSWERSIASCDYPTYPIWQDRVEHILHLIATKQLHKLVLARTTALLFPSSPPLWELLNRFSSNNHSTTFAFRFSPQRALIGSTPETFYRRIHRKLYTYAIAGTLPALNSHKDKCELPIDRFGPKEHLECDYVKEGLIRALTPLSSHLQFSGKRDTIGTKHLIHLRERLQATLRDPIDDQHVIATLHPTAAVGSAPQDAAQRYLPQLESFDRGWYGSPVGQIGQDRSHLVTAIRSGLIIGHSLRLFAGAGIVAGSTPIKEWDETATKMAHFRSLIRPS